MLKLLPILYVAMCLMLLDAKAHDLEALTETICEWETRGVPEHLKDSTPGTSGEIGRCQIKYETARWLGYRGSRDGLAVRRVNEYWALQYVALCHSPRRNTRRVAFCYNAGHNARYRPSRYARAINERYLNRHNADLLAVVARGD